MAQYAEGQIAEGPNGQQLVYSGGKWRSPAAVNGPVAIGGASPKVQYEGPQAAATLAKTQTDVARGPAEIRKTNAEATKAEAEAKKATAESANVPDPKIQQAIDGLQLDDMLHAIQRARGLIQDGNNTGVSGALRRVIPGSTANDLPGALSTIGGNILLNRLAELKKASATGASGLGALSNKEGDYLRDSVGSLGIRQSDPALLDALSQVERHVNSLRAIRDGQDPTKPEVQKQYGLIAAAPGAQGGAGGGGTPPTGGASVGGASGTPLGLSPGGGQSVVDPALSGVNAEVARRIKGGQSEAQIRGYLEKIRPGLGANAANIGAWVQFNRVHPNEPIAVSLDRVEKPLTPAGSALNTAAQSPFGAYAMGAGDFLSGGTLDNMTSNPALARAGMAGVAQAHPYANLAGQVSGGALAGAGVEGGLGRLGISGVRAALAGDVLPNIGYGAGSADDGDRITGGMIGGGAGLFGNLAGRAVGGSVRGTTNKAVQGLNDLGIRMTPGQAIGGVAKSLEDRFAGYPFIGDLIKSQQRTGAKDWNKAVFKDAAPVVNDIGQAGYAALKEAEKNAYQGALGGVSVSPDPQFAQDFAGAFGRGANVPTLGQDFAHVVQNNVIPQAPGPVINGSQFQDALRVLRKKQSGYNKMADTAVNPLGSDVADALGGVEDAYTGLVNRQAPGVMPALNEANAMHAKKMTIAGALPATDDQLMTPIRLAQSSMRNRTKFGGLDAAMSGDRPFNDLTNWGQEVLPSKIPDSGTAGRASLLALAAPIGATLGAGGEYANTGTGQGAMEGAGTGGLTGLLAAGALTSPYIARGAIQKLLAARRGKGVQDLGQAIMDYRLLGAPFATSLLPSGN